jgi:hypothetical protein
LTVLNAQGLLTQNIINMKNLKNLKGAKKLSKMEQKAIKGGYACREPEMWCPPGSCCEGVLCRPC